MTGLNNSYAKFNADTNLAMAKFAANGDYANAIAGINAKVQDSRMIAPTTSGGVGVMPSTLLPMGGGLCVVSGALMTAL